MGQELLSVQGWIRKPRKYYLATNSKGHKVVRGSNGRFDFTHATIYGDLYNTGYCYATFTTRLELAQRYAKRWKGSEVVEIKEITAKEARQYKKEIHKTAEEYQEQKAKQLASVYDIDLEKVRETSDN